LYQNITLALSVYLRAGVHEKVIGCFLSLGAQEADEAAASEHFKKIMAYTERFKFPVDYSTLVMNLLRVNSVRAKDFAVLLLQDEKDVKINVSSTIDAFLQQGDAKSTTEILLQYLKPRGDRQEDAQLQVFSIIL
jgi:clathrin heavy chain